MKPTKTTAHKTAHGRAYSARLTTYDPHAARLAQRPPLVRLWLALQRRADATLGEVEREYIFAPAWHKGALILCGSLLLAAAAAMVSVLLLPWLGVLDLSFLQFIPIYWFVSLPLALVFWAVLILLFGTNAYIIGACILAGALAWLVM